MTMIHLLFGGFGLCAGFGLSWVFMRAKSAKDLAQAVARSEYDALSQSKAQIEGKFEALHESHHKLETELDATKRELTEYRERTVTAAAEKNALDTRLKEQGEELDKMRQQIKQEFQNTATKIFEEMSSKFSTQSEKNIGDLLNPLRERLGEFQKMVGESFTTQGKEQHVLKSEIERIVTMNEQMRLQAEGLTKALRGDVKAQGNWGEVMLERILEESGLRAGQDYITQAVEMKLTDGDGNRQQPDVIVKLPDDKHIIVDAKVSLTAYDRFCSADDDIERQLQVKEFIKSIKNHVLGLEKKKYQQIDALGTPDFVLMFLPVEGAYSLAVQHDPELHAFAWGRKVVLVCPATLFATLRTIASLWQIDQQNKYAKDIADEGGKLYDKFTLFVDSMQKIDKGLDVARGSYDEAMKRLTSGTGNLIGRAEKLKTLGAKTSKSLPADLVGESDEETIVEAINS